MNKTQQTYEIEISGKQLQTLEKLKRLEERRIRRKGSIPCASMGFMLMNAVNLRIQNLEREEALLELRSVRGC